MYIIEDHTFVPQMSEMLPKLYTEDRVFPFSQSMHKKTMT